MSDGHTRSDKGVGANPDIILHGDASSNEWHAWLTKVVSASAEVGTLRNGHTVAEHHWTKAVQDGAISNCAVIANLQVPRTLNDNRSANSYNPCQVSTEGSEQEATPGIAIVETWAKKKRLNNCPPKAREALTLAVRTP